MSQGDAAQESKLYLPSEATVAAAAVSGMAAYESLCKQADGITRASGPAMRAAS